MGHLIEEYAKSLGVKIGKPKIVDHYYPLPFSKYITIHNDSKFDSRNYEYFTQVINLIKPTLLSLDIKIIQIGTPDNPHIPNVDLNLFNLNIKQSSFIIKNSLVHVGIDSLPVHIASAYDVPIVALYSNVNLKNSEPVWSSKEKVTLLESNKNGNRPSYAVQENPKTIRTIKPESIASSIFKHLNINAIINFNTLYIGSNYHNPVVEVVPNFMANLEDQKDKVINIRADLHSDEQKMAFWCSNYKCRIFSNQIISLELLKTFSSNIQFINFILEDDSIPVSYFEAVKNLKINFLISTKSLENLSKIRNTFFDFRVEFDNEKERIEKQEKFKCKFFTAKVLLSEACVYASEAHAKLKKPLDNPNEVIYDEDSFWKDSEHFYFYE
jgi:hypothetical protein